jgi:hypothetical protein
MYITTYLGPRYHVMPNPRQVCEKQLVTLILSLACAAYVGIECHFVILPTNLDLKYLVPIYIALASTYSFFLQFHFLFQFGKPGSIDILTIKADFGKYQHKKVDVKVAILWLPTTNLYIFRIHITAWKSWAGNLKLLKE